MVSLESMNLLENRFIRAIVFFIANIVVVIGVGLLLSRPPESIWFLGVISGLVFAFLSIFLRIGGPEWGGL